MLLSPWCNWFSHVSAHWIGPPDTCWNRVLQRNLSSNDMLFWMEPSRRKALDPQLTHINGTGFPIQNELAHNHSGGRALHHPVTAKAAGDEQVLHPRDGPQDRVVVWRVFIHSCPPVLNPCLFKNRNPLDRIFH